MAEPKDEKDTGEGTTGGIGSSPGAAPAPEQPATMAERLKSFVIPSSIPATPKVPTAPTGVPEPVILEEHIIEKTVSAPAAKPVPAISAMPVVPPTIPAAALIPPEFKPSAATPPPVAIPATPPAPMSAPPIVKPTASSLAEDVGLALPNKMPEIKMPASLMPDSFSSKPVLPPTEKALPGNPAFPGGAPPPSPIPPLSVPSPKEPVSAPLPIAPTMSTMGQVVKPASGSGGINTDIEKILREVKLPERRDFKATADTAPATEAQTQMPKDMASMVTKPPTDAESASAMVSKPDAGNLSSMHTLKDDLQHAVKEKKMSLVRAVSLEQDKKRTELIEEDFGRKERRKRVGGVLFASALLFLLGGAALFGVYLVMLSHSATDVQQLNSLVFAEQSVALPLDNASPSELKRRVAAQRQAQTGSLGSITSIVPIYQGEDQTLEPQRATTVEFLQAIGANAPDNLMRSVGEVFFFGLHVVDKNAPVLVIPITNYDRAFAGMLAWEHTMNADLSPTFTPVPAVVLDANGIPSERVFKDDVMRNYDVRELKDDSGQIQLYYSFPSPNLLIIAESPYSFPELLSRLQSVRRL